jgi:RimJ/RimL family protein N-acetyltransferase
MNVEIATEADIAGIMTVESTPGFEDLICRWSGDQHRAEMAKPSVRYFVLRDNGEVTGFAIIQGLGDPDRKAHLKRIAVREVGGGMGSELLRAVLHWLFTETDTNRIDLDVYVENERARSAYEKTGFQVEGRLREYHRSADGSYRDMSLMSILRREWKGAAD